MVSEKASPAATRTPESALAVWVKLAQELVKSPDAMDRQLAGAIARYVQRAANAGDHRTHAKATEREAARAAGDAVALRAGPERGRTRPKIEWVRTGPEIER